MRRATYARACPKCGGRLNGGPTHYTCEDGHGIPAADLHHERIAFTDPQAEREAREAARAYRSAYRRSS